MKLTRLTAGAVAAGLIIMIVGMAPHASAQAANVGAPATTFGGTGTSGLERTGESGGNAGNSGVLSYRYGDATLRGQVVVEWARLPWDPIPIVVTCDHVVRYRTRTDAQGRFFITTLSLHQWPGKSLGNCEVAAQLPGFTSTKFDVTGMVVMDNLDIGSLILRPASDATATVESQADESAPRAAMKRFEKAYSEWTRGHMDKAGKDLKKAVAIDPGFADAWYGLGRVEQADGQFDAALVSYNRAIAADPWLVPPRLHIAEISALRENWPLVQKTTAWDLTFYPQGTPQLWYYSALANYHLGNVDRAEVDARKSMAMDPQHLVPDTEQLLAVMLATQGNYADALAHLRNCLTYLKPGPNTRTIQQQISLLEQALPEGAAR